MKIDPDSTASKVMDCMERRPWKITSMFIVNLYYCKLPQVFPRNLKNLRVDMSSPINNTIKERVDREVA